MQTTLGKHWHQLPDIEVLVLLETDRDHGLDSSEVTHRRQQFGANVLTQKKGKSPLTLFLSQLFQPLVYILLSATVVTALLQEWIDAGCLAVALHLLTGHAACVWYGQPGLLRVGAHLGRRRGYLYRCGDREMGFNIALGK